MARRLPAPTFGTRLPAANSGSLPVDPAAKYEPSRPPHTPRLGFASRGGGGVQEQNAGQTARSES